METNKELAEPTKGLECLLSGTLVFHKQETNDGYISKPEYQTKGSGGGDIATSKLPPFTTQSDLENKLWANLRGFSLIFPRSSAVKRGLVIHPQISNGIISFSKLPWIQESIELDKHCVVQCVALDGKANHIMHFPASNLELSVCLLKRFMRTVTVRKINVGCHTIPLDWFVDKLVGSFDCEDLTGFLTATTTSQCGIISGIIDSDYEGEIKLSIYATKFVAEATFEVELAFVETFQDGLVVANHRGVGGFGSTDGDTIKAIDG